MWGFRKITGMSTEDDVRKAIQDFLAPELRTISARLDGLERVMSARFEAMDVKFGSVDVKLNATDERISALDIKIGVKLDSLSKQIQGIDEKLDIDRRLTRLETRQSPATQ
jgi:hypothetical protein